MSRRFRPGQISWQLVRILPEINDENLPRLVMALRRAGKAESWWRKPVRNAKTKHPVAGIVKATISVLALSTMADSYEQAAGIEIEMVMVELF